MHRLRLPATLTSLGRGSEASYILHRRGSPVSAFTTPLSHSRHFKLQAQSYAKAHVYKVYDLEREVATERNLRELDERFAEVDKELKGHTNITRCGALLPDRLRYRMDEITPKVDYKFWTKRDLINRIDELERLTETSIADSSLEVNVKKKKIKKQEKEFDFKAHPTRLVALRFAYLGWNYNGLNVQFDKTPLPTVEGLILKALARCRLIESEVDLKGCEFSRCGRTDKGVSALAQVISLKIRSRLSPEEQQDEANDDREFPYITQLNHALPPDIRVYQVCLHPPEGFDARHSCRSRHYKYFFAARPGELDINAMSEAARMLVGTHDFRNFCKIDGSKQMTHFYREILSASFSHVKSVASAGNDTEPTDVYVFDLHGTAFLWHQVRCIMGILFLVGQRLEQPAIVANLLDVERYPCKPIYDMADDVPLVLYDCEFDSDVRWKTATDLANGQSATPGSTIADVYALWYDGVIKNEMQRTMRNVLESAVRLPERAALNPRLADRVQINVGDGWGKWRSAYEPVEKRKVTDHFEVQNERYRSRKVRVGEHAEGEQAEGEEKSEAAAA
ncbi:pseudouridine synthase [Myxozyma melibiosi]|uniref:Pseudouridine synthase n=1 Tax=Myxozyma melibiosi TaxID=54550 RepID=A0ABR1F0S2_9ASCO